LGLSALVFYQHSSRLFASTPPQSSAQSISGVFASILQPLNQETESAQSPSLRGALLDLKI